MAAAINTFRDACQCCNKYENSIDGIENLAVFMNLDRLPIL
ncbi:MAG: hypothetical protein RR957_03010 [Oscillospiraceae bacterium]